MRPIPDLSDFEFVMRLVARGFPVSPINGDVPPTSDPETIRSWLESKVELRFHGFGLRR